MRFGSEIDVIAAAMRAPQAMPSGTSTGVRIITPARTIVAPTKMMVQAIRVFRCSDMVILLYSVSRNTRVCVAFRVDSTLGTKISYVKGYPLNNTKGFGLSASFKRAREKISRLDSLNFDRGNIAQK